MSGRTAIWRAYSELLRIEIDFNGQGGWVLDGLTEEWMGRISEADTIELRWDRKKERTPDFLPVVPMDVEVYRG